MTNGSTERKTGKFGRDPRIIPISPMTGTRVEDRATEGAEDGSTNRSTNPTRREHAVETSRQGQEKLGASTVERKEISRNEMTRFGVHEDQIQKILEGPNINFNGVTDVRGTQSYLPPQQHLGESATPGPAGEAERDVGVSKSNGSSWCTLQGCVDPVPKPCYHLVSLLLIALHHITKAARNVLHAKHIFQSSQYFVPSTFADSSFVAGGRKGMLLRSLQNGLSTYGFQNTIYLRMGPLYMRHG